MTHNEKLITVRAMKRYSGGFVRALSEAWLMADEDNCRRIEAAFPEYIGKYGPGSDFYAATEKVEA